MLNAQSDRIDYRELLSPPTRYKVSFVVGTTYSLDLETLTAICAMIGLGVEPDTELTKSPLHMLEAIRKASGKLLIFCQSGQIKVPDKPNQLLPLLENCVSEISLSYKRSFHPKMWILKYTADGLPDHYRLIVMSRNLTLDRSWDVALCLNSVSEGEKTIEKGAGAGEAMRTFLQWLHTNASSHNSHFRTKKKQLYKLANEMADIKWQHLGKTFEGFDFIPFGIGHPSTVSLFDSFHKIFVISPFLSKTIFERFAQKRLSNPDCTLITRKSELSKLDADLLTVFNTYTMKDDIIDGEERISESGEFKRQDIHAKVYLRTKGANSELYIGSANASRSAFFGGNVECMVMLWGKQKYLNVENLRQELFGADEKANPFEKILPKDYTATVEDTVMTMLEHAVRDFCALHKVAVVSGKEKYTITVTMKLVKSDIKMTLSPMMRTNHQPLSDKMTFIGLNLRELSEWYIVTAKSRGKEVRRALKIRTAGIPDDRDAEVFSGMISNKDAFLTYIAFLLSDDYLATFLESRKRGEKDFRFLNQNFETPILYERMLKAASKDQKSLREIRDIILLTNQKNVPQEFLKLYEKFEKVVKP